MVIQNFATVNTETSPLSALMTPSLPAIILLRVRIKMQFSRGGRFSHNMPYTVARTQEVDVTSQLRMGVRMLQAQAHKCVQMFMFLFSLVSYILLGEGRMFTSATPVSFQNPWLCMYFQG